MANRKPLVLVGGYQSQLPPEDYINVQVQNGLNSITQLNNVRTSSPYNSFDSFFRSSKEPLLWDELIVGTAAATKDANGPWVNLTIGTANNDRIVRQSKRYIPYEAGKEVRVQLTGIWSTPLANRNQFIGQLSNSNGVYFGYQGTTFGVGKRSSITGSVIDTFIQQSEWNIDTMDGNGSSGITLDPTKIQLYVIDYIWQGAGDIIYSVVIDQQPRPVHYISGANYTSSITIFGSPNLPIRYELVNVGTVASSGTMQQICANVNSYGGYEPKMIPFSAGTGGPTAGLTYISVGNGVNTAVFALRLKSAHIRETLKLDTLTVLHNSNQSYIIRYILNPTLTGGTWTSVGDESYCDYWVASGTNNYTGGRVIFQDLQYGANNIPRVNTRNPQWDYLINSTISGTSDILAIAAIATGTVGLDVRLNWQELH
jgi:hypothetical protein